MPLPAMSHVLIKWAWHDTIVTSLSVHTEGGTCDSEGA